MSKRVRVGIILHLRRLEHLHEGDAHAFGDGRDIFQDRHILIGIPKAARERRFRRCPLVTNEEASQTRGYGSHRTRPFARLAQILRYAPG